MAVLGQLASLKVVGDLGSSHVRAPHVITALQGITEIGKQHGVVVETTKSKKINDAVTIASRSEAAIVVVGNTFRDEGEWMFTVGGDRKTLTLREQDIALIRAVAAVNKRTIVVLIGGSSFITSDWHNEVKGLLMAWYPGMEGGYALADVLFGNVFPGGRLPCTWSEKEADLPPFKRFTREITYGPLHGYRMAEATKKDPAFAFGFGLGYTKMDMSQPQLLKTETRDGKRTVHVEVDVKNTGTRNGIELIQAYVQESLGTEPRALRTLRSFEKLKLRAGETQTAKLNVPILDTTKSIWVGTSSRLVDLIEISLV